MTSFIEAKNTGVAWLSPVREKAVNFINLGTSAIPISYDFYFY